MTDSDLPARARVVVIGGGVVGCAILYHLAKKGWRDLLLLERRELSCGSSWHAAGNFHIINSNANLSALQLHTLKFYPQLEKESGQSVGMHRTGGIYLASSPERMNYLVQEQAKHRIANPDMQFISLEEAREKHPLIDPQHFLGALYDPLDGHIDPAGVVQAFAKAARNLGASVLRQTKVSALRQKASGEWEITTDKGALRAEHVVNAGGLWAREVGRMAGIELPVQAMEHHYLITDSLEDIENLGRELPSMVDFDGNAYGRQEGMGMLLGVYEENGTPWSVDETPWDFGHELLPDDLSRIAPRLETAFQHFPKLAQAGIKKVVNGPFTFAPDGNALIGPVPGLRNFWSACGVMAGFCQGAGIGKVFADWMAEGEPGMDVFAMDVARFGEFAGRKYAVAKAVENFGRRFQVSYPNEELPAMRPLRTTALYGRLAAAGAVFGCSFGLEHALWFGRPGEMETPTFLRSNAHPAVAAEVRAVRENAGYIETANFAKHAISGPGAEEFLDGILACRMPDTGRMRLAPMLSPGGKLIGDLSVAKLGENDFLLFGSGAAQLAHQRYFLARMPKSGVQTANLSAQLHGLAIAGPRARDILAKLTREDVSAKAFRFMDIRRMETGGVPAIVARVSFTGELGYEIYCAPEYLRALHDAVQNADGDLRPFGARAFMSMRLEKGFGAWTMDFREDFTPAESGLDAFIDFSKAADFTGKKAAQAHVPQRRRITLVIDSPRADACGDEPVYLDGAQIGFITSGGFGHTIGKSLAVGYIGAEYAKEGAKCAVEILGEKCPATICLRPPYDPEGKKMRS
ncbi:MAG: GcvT family protein [Gammaproteobacteria bacterium]